jgi:hypothetical protein
MPAINVQVTYDTGAEPLPAPVGAALRALFAALDAAETAGPAVVPGRASAIEPGNLELDYELEGDELDALISQRAAEASPDDLYDQAIWATIPEGRVLLEAFARRPPDWRPDLAELATESGVRVGAANQSVRREFITRRRLPSPIQSRREKGTTVYWMTRADAARVRRALDAS